MRHTKSVKLKLEVTKNANSDLKLSRILSRKQCYGFMAQFAAQKYSLVGGCHKPA